MVSTLLNQPDELILTLHLINISLRAFGFDPTYNTYEFILKQWVF